MPDSAHDTRGGDIRAHHQTPTHKQTNCVERLEKTIYNAGTYENSLTLHRKPPVAQLDRALPSGGRGQRFESSRAGH